MNNPVGDSSKQKMRFKRTREGTYRLQKSGEIDEKRLHSVPTGMGNGRARRSKKVHVSMFCDSEPPKAAIQMLLKIRKSQKKLVDNICKVFFDDLHQDGYHSETVPHSKFGMWWSEDPVEVAMSCREALEKRLKRDRLWQPEDVLAILYEPFIAIYPSETGDETLPRTLINMGAEFEDEHGVSVLTDGVKVLNLGYMGEA